ncbi:hypothetical protein NQ314_006479 [Rhamnusium bicolor]|uniref:CHK kinase-like domain-containing protein n=1 Tax=Rhamnusium bicolor TaxID=1586634 RepID=A0AAV8Z3G5_9CUCU|nr:hypothetical protein NQ314_006479 [Rhamnusium bicolor]
MDNVVSPRVYDIIKEVVDEDIEKFSISVHEANKKGEGYLGQMCFVSLRNRNNGKTFNLVIKEAFADEVIRINAPIRNVFLNEINFYTKVWPCFQNFKNKTPSIDFDKIPKCFATISDEGNEKIVLENIKYQNFEIYDKTKAFEREHIEFIFTQYGKFHALSFAYRAFYPERYSDLSKELTDIYSEFTERKPFRDSLEYILDFCSKSLQPGEDDEVIQKYKHYVENCIDKFYNSNNYTGDYSVIIHGDCWSNNMMFKYDLVWGASKKVLDDLDYYLKVYHNSLSETLNEFGCNAEELYPFAELKKDWKHHCQLGFTMGLLLWRVKLTSEEDVLDLTDFKEEFDTNTSDLYFNIKYDEATYKERSRNLILHMYENDFL